MQMRRPNALGY